MERSQKRPPAARTIRLNGERCQAYRLKLHLTQEQLASLAKGSHRISLATIKRAEGSEPIFLASARTLAALMNTDVESLRDSAVGAGVPSQTPSLVSLTTTHQEAPALSQVSTCASDIEPLKQALLKSAQKTIWCYGTSFHVTATMHRHVLTERVRAGVDVRYLFADPFGSYLPASAASFGQPEAELITEIEATRASFARLVGELRTALGALAYRVSDEVFEVGFYLYDVDEQGGGTLILVPHIWGSDAPTVPAIILSGPAAREALTTYCSIFKAKWSATDPQQLNRCRTAS